MRREQVNTQQKGNIIQNSYGIVTNLHRGIT